MNGILSHLSVYRHVYMKDSTLTAGAHSIIFNTSIFADLNAAYIPCKLHNAVIN